MITVCITHNSLLTLVNHSFYKCHFYKCHLLIAWRLCRETLYVFTLSLRGRATEHKALKEIRCDLVTQDWSAVKGFLWWSQIWLSQASALSGSYFRNDIAVLNVNTYSVAGLFHYFNTILIGWYLRLVSGSAIGTSPEMTQSEISGEYQVCLQPLPSASIMSSDCLCQNVSFYCVSFWKMEEGPNNSLNLFKKITQGCFFFFITRFSHIEP